jgi:hypothetical protein
MSDEEKQEDQQHRQEGEGEGHMGGLLIGTRSLWLIAGGALGALAALSLEKITGKVRPAAVSAVKEGYAFKEWVAGRYEKVKEDFEDIAAEAIYEYEREQGAAADETQREKAILERIERIVEERLSKIDAEKGSSEEKEEQS